MTIDKTRLPVPTGTLPTFAPVPRKCQRHDGWTAERQRGFIEALADTGSVKSAAHAVNMTPEGAYLLRRHPAGGEFRAAWQAALACGVQRLEDVAMERALHGVEVPVYRFGEIVGTRRVYNDYLLMFILRNRLGERFAADARNPALDLTELRRKLVKQWRTEWEHEQAVADRESRQEVLDSLDAKLERMRESRRATMSPRTRELFAQAKRAHAEDEAAGYYLHPRDDPDAADYTELSGGAEELLEADAKAREIAAMGAVETVETPEDAVDETGAATDRQPEPPAEPEPAPAPGRPAGPRVWRVDDDPYARFRRMTIEE